MANRSLSLYLILALHVTMAITYGLVTPIYEGPDEIGHVLYVKHIAEGEGIPVQTREYAISYGFGQEGSQTPLYYALNAALVRGLGLSLDDRHGLPAINPFSTCGRPQGGGNLAFYRHDPRQETFPFQGAARAVHVMRLFSALLGGVTIVAVYAATRLTFPDVEAAALLAAALVAFNPQFAFMGGVVNNDNLVNCLTAVAVALALYCLRRGFTWQRAVALGVVCGLAPLAKLGGLMALVFAGLVVLVALWRRPGRMVGMGALVGVAFLATAGWWFVRNWMLYGDPSGVNRMLSIYGGRGGWPAHLIIPEIFDTFRSYWAFFACGLSFPPGVHWGLGILVVAGIVGLVAGWQALGRSRTAVCRRDACDPGRSRTDPTDRQVVWVLLIWLVLVTVMWVRWNHITYAPLGRLLFQANAAIAALLGYGLVRLTSRPRWMLAGVGTALFVLTVSGALLVVRPAFALPGRYPAASAPAPPQVLSEVAFGDEIAAVGYDLSAHSAEPGQVLDVALYLQASRPITEDYALSLQLVSLVPGDTSTLVNLNAIPGAGLYPTYAWRPDEMVVDRYRMRIPQRVLRPQTWRLAAIIYRLTDGRRVPVTVSGQPAGKMLDLGLVRVGASEPPAVPAEARINPGPVYGGAIALRGAQIRPEQDVLRVALWWEGLAPLGSDYTVFVHLVDRQRQLTSTGDGPPLAGGFPTRMWRPGDHVSDEYVIPLPPDLPADIYAVQVGWYDPITGTRLAATQASERVPEDAVVIGAWSGP
jgi:hypothetical protein